jgi:ABC-type multidrug transport system ATPase subunit
MNFLALIVTNTDELMSFAETVVVLENGRIAEIGSPQALSSYEGYVAKLGSSLRDEGPISEHTEDTEISRIQSPVAESSTSMPDTIEEATGALDLRRKNGDWSVYSYYFSTSGYKIIMLFLFSMASWVFTTEFASRCAKSAQFGKRLTTSKQ